MAIAKVQYKENASATPEVWMDTTQKTVTAGTMLSGTTALKNDGTGITGNIDSKSSSDLTASGATVTAPAGYYPNAASKSVATTTHPNPTASINATTGVVTASHTQTAGYVSAGTTTGTLPLTTQAAKTVAPTESEQTAVSAGVYTTGVVKVGAISSTYVGSDVAQNDSSDLTASGATVTAPAGFYAESASKTVASGSASTPATSITANPTISVNASGLITASVSGSKSVTPTVSSGYVTSGTAGTISVSGSNTEQLSTQAGTTITPTESEQTAVASGKFTTGAVKVGAISSTYVGSGITQRDSTDLTESGATVTAPAGYYAEAASKSVASGTAGTPTATKGTVSNHSISVTPSVTNTTGYITGGTKNGTAVTVNVSELESGTKTITENGTGISVSGYSAVNVDVPGQTPTGVKYVYTDIDGEGAWNVAGYEYCSVDYAPVWDGSLRYWFNIPSANYTQTITYYISNVSETGPQGIIDWGDGTIDTSLESASTASHEYASAGRYCVKITPTGARGRTNSYVAGNDLNTDNTTLFGAECIDAGTTTKQIAGSAFRRCTNLKKVSIKNDIVEINSYAFANSGITELTIPSSVEAIGSYCFQRSSLLKIHMKPTSPPTLGTAAFQGTPSSLVIYVPQGYLSAYQSATNWSSYASKMQEE